MGWRQVALRLLQTPGGIQGLPTASPAGPKSPTALFGYHFVPVYHPAQLHLWTSVKVVLLQLLDFVRVCCTPRQGTQPSPFPAAPPPPRLTEKRGGSGDITTHQPQRPPFHPPVESFPQSLSSPGSPTFLSISRNTRRVDVEVSERHSGSRPTGSTGGALTSSHPPPCHHHQDPEVV